MHCNVRFLSSEAYLGDIWRYNCHESSVDWVANAWGFVFLCSFEIILISSSHSNHEICILYSRLEPHILHKTPGNQCLLTPNNSTVCILFCSVRFSGRIKEIPCYCAYWTPIDRFSMMEKPSQSHPSRKTPIEQVQQVSMSDISSLSMSTSDKNPL